MLEKTTYPDTLQHVISYFSHLPGIGRRTAERLGLALMSWRPEDVAGFGAEIGKLRSSVTGCAICGNYTEAGFPCGICSSENRQRGIICVVEQVSQIHVIEKSGCFHGLYHVLGGKLSPVNGIGPGDLRLKELAARLDAGVSELLLAITPDVEGEATAHYIAHEFARPGLSISRIAAGVPVGADLAFADAATLASAISGRRVMDD